MESKIRPLGYIPVIPGGEKPFCQCSRTMRLKDIIDLSTGDMIMELEHETRPLRHCQYLKVPKYEPKYILHIGMVCTIL
jgi:hypothetical protein